MALCEPVKTLCNTTPADRQAGVASGGPATSLQENKNKILTYRAACLSAPRHSPPGEVEHSPILGARNSLIAMGRRGQRNAAAGASKKQGGTGIVAHSHGWRIPSPL